MSEVDVKNLIIESATKFFSKFGFNKTRVDEIARHTHKAKGVIYYYFKSKEELFNEVLKQELGSVQAELSQIIIEGSDSLTTLKEYILVRLKLLHDAVNYHETLKADFFEKYYFVKDVRDNFNNFERNQLTYILKKGKEEGYLDFKDINSAVNIIMMVLNGIEIPLFLQNKYTEYESTFDELATMIVSGLRNQIQNKKL